MEVAVVSLSARERHALQGIEDRLIGSDPKLAATLATFNRLASDEEMPTEEMVPPARCDPRGARRLLPGLALRRVMPLMWVLIAIVAIAVIAALSSRASGDACARTLAVACGSPAPAHSSPGARDRGQPAAASTSRTHSHNDLYRVTI
jgi:hypothetical protein